MTPLAAKVANELTLPKAKRTFDDTAHVLDLFDQEMHCFEVSALTKSVNAVLDDPIADGDPDESWSVWRDVESMVPRMFLPSPVTWLEQTFNGARLGCVIQQRGEGFWLASVHQSAKGPFSLHICDFRARSILEPGERLDIELGDLSKEVLDTERDPVVDRIMAGGINEKDLSPERLSQLRAGRDLIEARLSLLERKSEMAGAGLEIMQMAKRFIGMTILTLDLINTPGLVGLKQRDPHRGLARRLNAIGRYPLRAWSEVVLKAETRAAEPGEQMTGTGYHKCLHFVRSHLRHYQDGHVTVIPAHWRGDPALGIKRTRYRMAA